LSGYGLSVSQPDKRTGIQVSFGIIFVLWVIIISSIIKAKIEKSDVLKRATACPKAEARTYKGTISDQEVLISFKDYTYTIKCTGQTDITGTYSPSNIYEGFMRANLDKQVVLCNKLKLLDNNSIQIVDTNTDKPYLKMLIGISDSDFKEQIFNKV
jgi:hypothetical protein